MTKGNRKIGKFDVDSMRAAVSNMMSDPDMMDDIRAMGNRVLGRLSKQIENFKQIKAKLLEDPAFGATYAISTCELLSNVKNKTWKTQADIKEKFYDKIKQRLKDFGGEKYQKEEVLKKESKSFYNLILLNLTQLFLLEGVFITNKDIDNFSIFDVNLSIVIKPAKLSINDEAKDLCKDIEEIKSAKSGAEQNQQIIKAVENLLENNIKKIVHDYNFMKGGTPEGVL